LSSATIRLYGWQQKKKKRIDQGTGQRRINPSQQANETIKVDPPGYGKGTDHNAQEFRYIIQYELFLGGGIKTFDNTFFRWPDSICQLRLPVYWGHLQ
jgi:hypothetical protein